MSEVVTIAGSPSTFSRSSAVLQHARQLLGKQGISSHNILVRDLPAEDLLAGRADSPAIQAVIKTIENTQAVIIATPVYKAAYTGILKVFLDLLPQTALAGKVVLPIATGGSAAHTLAIDYALKPVLAALGARHILSGIYLVDSQYTVQDGELVGLETALERRLEVGLSDLVAGLGRPQLLAL